MQVTVCHISVEGLTVKLVILTSSMVTVDHWCPIFLVNVPSIHLWTSLFIIVLLIIALLMMAIFVTEVFTVVRGW